MVRTTLALIFAFFTSTIAYAQYSLPNNDADCPNNCRAIPWSAGSDQWNGGALPLYTSVTCTGLVQGDGTTDNGAAIQACINNAPSNTAVLIPPGIYYLNRRLTLKSRVVLRGSGSGTPYLPQASSAATTLKLGPSGGVQLGDNHSQGTERAIVGGFTKGSQSLTLVSGHGFVQGDWISVFEDGDPEIPTTVNGDAGTCEWCGENNGSNLIQQYVQVTSVSGQTVGIHRPLYYRYFAANNPGAKKVSWSISYAGVENMRLNGWSASRSAPFIEMEGALFSWVKNVETYNAPDVNKANHVNVRWSHGVEIRDSYFHFGRGSGSDTNYGIAFFFWNSDHKVENNILRHHRHSLSFEGGGSGIAVLYNYIDDNYTDDLSYLGSARTNHGGHPMFNLYEGNHISHLEADDVWGSSSHIVFFRNWLRGNSTGTGVPSFPPDGGFWAAHIDRLNVYYSLVGNVLGEPSWGSGTRLEVTQSSHCDYGTRTAYAIGCSDGTFFSSPRSTAIKHGNFDYVTDGVAFWQAGASQALRSSVYYSSKPSFFGQCNWPVFGPDLNPITRQLPAKARFDGLTTCGDTDPNPTPTPAAPTNLRIIR
jgi:hypothetical protein